MFAMAIAGLLAGATPHADADDTAELDRLLADNCDKKVVMLGEEASHGSGTAIELKGRIVKRLIDECRFSGVVFESGIYDFLALEQALADGIATREQLADAIGGLWSTKAEMEPLIDHLFRRARRGKVKLMGMDFQAAGATYGYAQHRLAEDLFGTMRDNRKQVCIDTVATFANWRFDEVTAFDEAFRERMRGCLDEVHSPRGSAAWAMTRNLRLNTRTPTDPFDVRDRAMFDNLLWHMNRLGRDAQVIVWTATVHGAKQPMPPRQGITSMGKRVHRRFGKRAAAVGITALQGSYGDPPQPLDAAAEHSLEGRAFESDSETVRYLDANDLARLGSIESRAIDYSAPARARWDRIVDGMLVIPREHPPTAVHAARPRHDW